MQTSKRGLKTELGREGWLCWAQCRPKAWLQGSRAATPCPCPLRPVTPREHGAPGYSLTRAGQEAPTALCPGVFAEHLRAELTQPSRPEQTQGKGGWALPAPGSALTATLKTTSSSILGLTHLKSSSPLPCPVKGSCRLNYNICNCANSS